MDNPDFFCIKCLNEGDAVAFKTLYDKYKTKLYAFALYLSKNVDDAEEIVQIAFISVWENKEKIDPDKPFTHYLFRIVQNKSCDIFRKRIIENCYADYVKTHENDISDDFLTAINNVEMEGIIGKLLDKIPEQRRSVFKLSRYENLTYKQIALRLQMSENTVDFHIRQVLAYFRKELPKYLMVLLLISI